MAATEGNKKVAKAREVKTGLSYNGKIRRSCRDYLPATNSITWVTRKFPTASRSVTNMKSDGRQRSVIVTDIVRDVIHGTIQLIHGHSVIAPATRSIIQRCHEIQRI